MQLCTQYMLSGTNRACSQAIPYFYPRAGALYSTIEAESKSVEKWGTGLYNDLPLNKPLGALSLLGYETFKHDYKIPVSSHINLEYNGSYSCNLHWEF